MNISFLRNRQSGASLVTTLLMVVVVASLAGVGARIALSGERSSRGDRDREVAFQAAQAALDDAEFEVMSDKVRAIRGSHFCAKGSLAFPDIGCRPGTSASDVDWGKCASQSASQPIPSWMSVNWDREGVPIGTFTGGRAYPKHDGCIKLLRSVMARGLRTP
jgi:type IV pilus assembly protein PilX